MDYKYIKVREEDFKYYVTLARPAKRNAFTPTMVNELAYAFEQANRKECIKVVIIDAEGPIFCAGMDLKTFQNPELDEPNPAISNKDISLGEVFDNLHKPSIALVEGNVIAGAFLIVLGCTYVFTKSEVQFRFPELALGIFPFQVMASLLKVMPEKKVLQLCLETNYFDVNKALEFGIIDGILDEEKVDILIESFKDVSVRALSEGIRSLRALQDIPQHKKFAYLKSVLDGLRNN